MSECGKAQVPAKAGVAVMVVGAAVPVLVGYEIGLWSGSLVSAAAGFAMPALLLIAFRLGCLWIADLVSERVVRRSGQLCLSVYLILSAVRAIGFTTDLNVLFSQAGLAWAPLAAGLIFSGTLLVSAGRDLERRRLGWLTAVLVLSAIGAAIAIPKLGAARRQANQRACFANQKTIIGAIYMYNLDKNIKTDPTGNYSRYADELRRGGYIRSIPQDPGQGPNSEHHYELTGQQGTGIRCTVHGTFKL